MTVHERMVTLIRRSIEGLAGIWPEESHGHDSDDLYITGLTGAILAFVRTFYRAVAHREGLSAMVLGRSVVYGATVLYYLAENRDRVSQLVAQLNYRSIRTERPILETSLRMHDLTNPGRQHAIELLKRNARQAEDLERRARLESFDVEASKSEPQMAEHLGATKFVLAMRFFNQAVHLGRGAVRMAVSGEISGEVVSPTANFGDEGLAIATDYVIEAHMTAQIASASLLGFDSTVLDQLNSFRDEVFAEWREIFEEIFGEGAHGFWPRQEDEEE